MEQSITLASPHNPEYRSGGQHWLKQAINDHEVVVGIMVSELRTPMLAAILDAAQLHFAIIDQEHGAYGPETLANLISGFRNGICRPIVRVPETRREYFLTALELGAEGIMVPHVESRAQVEDMVRFGRYAPEGDRGLSLTRAHTGFKRVQRDQYIADTNNKVLLIAQIETQKAIDNLDEILSTPGLDMAFIGPSDLSLSCQVDSSVRSPEMRGIVDKVIATASRHNVAVGIQIYDMELAAELARSGIRMISCNTDINALLTGLSTNTNALTAHLTGSISTKQGASA